MDCEGQGVWMTLNGLGHSSVFKMEAKEEFGWLLSCVLASVGRCCTVVER